MFTAEDAKDAEKNRYPLPKCGVDKVLKLRHSIFLVRYSTCPPYKTMAGGYSFFNSPGLSGTTER
jgi:hypothetical protein